MLPHEGISDANCRDRPFGRSSTRQEPHRTAVVTVETLIELSRPEVHVGDQRTIIQNKRHALNREARLKDIEQIRSRKHPVSIEFNTLPVGRGNAQIKSTARQEHLREIPKAHSPPIPSHGVPVAPKAQVLKGVQTRKRVGGLLPGCYVSHEIQLVEVDLLHLASEWANVNYINLPEASDMRNESVDRRSDINMALWPTPKNFLGDHQVLMKVMALCFTRWVVGFAIHTKVIGPSEVSLIGTSETLTKELAPLPVYVAPARNGSESPRRFNAPRSANSHQAADNPLILRRFSHVRDPRLLLNSSRNVQAMNTNVGSVDVPMAFVHSLHKASAPCSGTGVCWIVPRVRKSYERWVTTN